MNSSDSGFFESSSSRTRSLLRTHTALRPGLVINRRSLQVFSHKNSEIPRRPSSRPSSRPQHTSGPTVMLNVSSSSSPTKSVKRGKTSAIKGKPTKRSGTVLRAVPSATACATAPLSPLEQDMATLPNQEILTNIARISPTSDGLSATRSLPQNITSRPRARSSSAVLSPIQAGTEMKFFSGSTDPRAIIGTYKHGIFHWEHKDKTSIDTQSFRPAGSVRSEPHSPSSRKSRRPRIQVIIPDDQRNRPLPSLPFFNHTKSRSASAEIVSGHEISPPSGSKSTRVRDSMVSPLSAQQHQQQPQNQLMSSINANISNTQRESSGKNNAPSHSNSSDESHADDASSVYSQPSSMTSNEATSPPGDEQQNNLRKRTVTRTFSIKSPVDVGIFDDEARVVPKSVNASAETGPYNPSPISTPPRRYAPHPPIEEDAMFQPTCPLRPARKPSNDLPRRQPSTRRSLNRSIRRRSLASNPKMGVLNQAMSRSESKQISNGIPSPTLSEAENDLEQHLTSFTDDNPFKWDQLLEGTKSSNKELSGPPPALPRKSSKRHSQFGASNFRLSQVPCDHIASQLKRNRSLGKGKGLTINIPSKSKRVVDSFVLSPIPGIPGVPMIPPKATKRSITPGVAENVILGILQSLDCLDDLFATAVANRGFYRVFKRHELDLMKATLRKMSPPAWEHREICYPGHDQQTPEDLERECPRRDYTPTTYLKYYMRDLYIIAALKSLIKDKCQSFLRPEISVALVSNNEIESSRVDDALWRIWTFCKIFGSGKGREEDIVAQMDWLKGGELVHQKTCTYSILTTDSIDMNDTLASAPECFAKGNEDGLTAEELFDMMELWNCLGVLLQPFEGRTIQAREHGVYENTEVRGGDIDGEEQMLDEWYYYLLTLGLSPVLDLAAPCRQTDASAFILASQNGWMNWKPPIFGGTRRNFLKEAASRVYEDKIAITYAESSTKEVQRQLSKQRIQRHITELRKRKNSGERMPEIRMSQERPMSEWEGVMDNLTKPRPPPPSSNIVSYIPSLRSAAPTSVLAQQLTMTVAELPASRTPPPPPRPRSPPRRVIAEPLLPTPPPSTVPSVADWEARSVAPSMPSIDEHPIFQTRTETIPSMPSLEEHPAFTRHLRQMSGNGPPPQTSSSSTPSLEEHPAFQQHPRQHEIFQSDATQNTAEKAVYRIVEMGFTAEQARHALRVTDLGDGLRVDRAVELLLREV
ncbi:uncharacterized protein BDR25DRAFT_294622 [Lindgomyces ingoldianus]|uniref:Uncharacterized protein n=1 Tax=Lindgomyces ingoldianus TaxID=673940 RepID=A0ACB6QGH1_9PLEO|nr:uncharacterized protein BDR25DRAFT_294622 [Lindgomyces ingoldianus]KAF2465986.1 hypothetical protein BDR25DRAFT_294622 [Lindgomyces ingoldianus]